MKSFLRFALRALLLLVVALVSAVTAMRFAIHGHEVAVPNLVGKTPAEAHHIVEDIGLELMMERQYYSDSVPEGRILSQLPVPGTLVRQGWQVRVAESLGKQRVDIPSVLGESERAAEMNIQRRGLDVSSLAQLPLPNAIADNVVAQNPVPAASGVSSPNIGLLVAEPAAPIAYVMPNFVGQTLGNASVAILDAGWHSANITASVAVANPPASNVATPNTANPNENAPAQTAPSAPLSQPLPTSASVIVSQIPAAGAKAVVGSPITFVVR